MTSESPTETFAARVVAWQRVHGRRDLPWQATRDAYRVWLSEIMLQQTQVATALPYFQRFVAAFPDVEALAAAPLERVLELWSGLGYYRRAHHLHAAARAVVERHGGAFPREPGAIEALPGIGRSTAAAIAAFAFGTRRPILDGNVKRVLARHRGIDGFPGAPRVERALWEAAEALCATDDIEDYTQGMMDLGATVCTRRSPRCESCPVRADCVAFAQQRVGDVPAPRPARRIVQRAVRVLAIERDGAILVERRPQRGVWSGLWSLPEAALDADVEAELRERFAIAPRSREALAPFAHAFTHFTLVMHPERVLVDRAGVCQDRGARWLERGEAASAALPAPIKRLIASLEGVRRQGLFASGV